jgi:hypothetical protein
MHKLMPDHAVFEADIAYRERGALQFRQRCQLSRNTRWRDKHQIASGDNPRRSEKVGKAQRDAFVWQPKSTLAAKTARTRCG